MRRRFLRLGDDGLWQSQIAVTITHGADAFSSAEQMKNLAALCSAIVFAGYRIESGTEAVERRSSESYYATANSAGPINRSKKVRQLMRRYSWSAPYSRLLLSPVRYRSRTTRGIRQYHETGRRIDLAAAVDLLIRSSISASCAHPRTDYPAQDFYTRSCSDGPMMTQIPSPQRSY